MYIRTYTFRYVYIHIHTHVHVYICIHISHLCQFVHATFFVVIFRTNLAEYFKHATFRIIMSNHDT